MCRKGEIKREAGKLPTGPKPSEAFGTDRYERSGKPGVTGENVHLVIKVTP